MPDNNVNVKYYNPCGHRGEYGYQNLGISRDFMAHVVSELTSVLPENHGQIYVFGMDNSTTFLATLLRLEIPNIYFISGSKTDGQKNNANVIPRPDKSSIFLYIDDFYSTGNALKKAIGYLARYYSQETTSEQVYAFFIATDESTAYIKHHNNIAHVYSCNGVSREDDEE